MNHASRLAWLNVFVHIAALLFAALALRPGSPLVPVSERMAYLAQAPLGWSLGWGTWMLCTLALIAFFAALAAHLPGQAELARLAVALASAGGAVDLFCDTLYIVVLPAIAAGGERAELPFLTVERSALAGGLIVANGLYSVGVLLLSWSLRSRPDTALARSVGYVVFGGGMVLVSAGFADSALLAALATGPTIGLFCLWTVLAARAISS